jgi:glycosyltransferase involved in cell wall biosynthesis
LRAVRILVVSTLYPPAVRGGYEVECADVVRRLREHHEVLVLTSDHALPAPVDEELVVRELPFFSHRKRQSFAAPLSAMRGARIAKRLLESFRPDLIYVWNGAQIPQAALRVLERSGVPVAYRICQHWFASLYRSDVFMRHLYPGDRGLRRVWAFLMRVVNRHPALRLDVTTVIPAAVCWNSDALRTIAPAPPTVDTIYEDKIYPATHQSELFRDVARSRAAAPTVLFSGRVSDEKGPDVAYRALAALRDRHGIDARLVLAGAADPAMARELEVLGAELGIEDRVECLGRIDGHALVPLMAGAHLMVIPSVWEEPAPLVATEAALARLPVVASRVGGIPEMLHPGEHALYFENRDADGCAAAMAEILTQPEDALARAERARVRGLELALPSYLEATERFVENAVAALERPASSIDPALPTERGARMQP